ncbi:MAG: NPCBM/NEW2 domain-containing protein [Candidatus Poribacteria bacterium]|nr:NPCBM/NEW2 domain-containing protein [Candidatus Poribacteria bacterium]
MAKRHLRFGLLTLAATMTAGLTLTTDSFAARDDCGDLPNNPPKPIKEVAKEEPAIQNDYSSVVEEDERSGVMYLTLVMGSTPKANDCGLNPANDAAMWTGWGGPLDGDNITIGEGPGTRNEIVIGGMYFPRGIGTHGLATFVYDLSGGDYKMFSAYVGMSDEKDPAECGVGGTADFVFEVDGKQLVKTDPLAGTAGGLNVPAFLVEFEIPSGASELTIRVGDGGDGISCDHAALGDAKLLTAQALAVDAASKSATTWGTLKNGSN